MQCDDLASWARAQSWARLSTDVQTKLRFLLLDTLGCAIAGRDHPATIKSARAAATSLGGPPAATGLASGTALPVLGAILDSGAAIRALDLNDIYWGRASGGHPSDMFAAALAIAEERDASVGEMLGAVAVGYELYIRLADAMDFRRHFDHTTATCMAAAVIAGTLRRLDEAAFANGLAIAFASAPRLSVLRRGPVSEVKAPAPALAQISGVLAMDLAATGLTGPVAGMDGEFGVRVVLQPDAEIASLVAAAPPTRVLEVAIKRYPCIGTGQTTVASAVALHDKLKGRVDRIRSVHLRVQDDAVARSQTGPDYRRPKNRETADHSLWALFAMALLDGKLTPAQFAAERWKADDAEALLAKTTMAADLASAERGRLAAQAMAILDDGTKVAAEVDYAPGHPKNPLGENGVIAKVREAMEPVIGAARAEAAIAAWRAADAHMPVRELLRPFI